MALIDSMGAWIRAICTSFRNYSYWNHPTLLIPVGRKKERFGSLFIIIAPRQQLNQQRTVRGYISLSFFPRHLLRYTATTTTTVSYAWRFRSSTKTVRNSSPGAKGKEKIYCMESEMIIISSRPGSLAFCRRIKAQHALPTTIIAVPVVLEGEGRPNGTRKRKITIYDFFSHFLISGNGCGHMYGMGSFFSLRLCFGRIART